MRRKVQLHSKKKGRFADSIVAVTGSGRGIGKNIACAFGREGSIVVICDIDKQKGRATESELHEQGISAKFLHVDLRHRGASQAMIQQIVQQWGRLDILVNNARSGRRMDLLEESENSWEEGISVTLRAAFFASQEAIHAMSQIGGGSIINISSIAALLTSHESPIYHIAKAGLLQMTRYLAVHAGCYGIRVNAVLPGFIVLDENRARYEKEENQYYREIAEFCHPIRHIGESNDVADAVLFLCSPEASFISGQCLVIDGGLILQEQSNLMFRLTEKYIEPRREII